MRRRFADHAHGVQCAASPVHISRAAADGAAGAVRAVRRWSGRLQREQDICDPTEIFSFDLRSPLIAHCDLDLYIFIHC